MGFMKKQTYHGMYAAVETREGTFFLPEDVTGSLDIDSQWGPLMLCKDECEAELWDRIVRQIKDYIPTSPENIESIEILRGKLYRLSAPGYMDRTDWTTDADSPEFDDDEE